MSAPHFAEHEAQLGRLVRVHGVAKPRWIWVALAASTLVYVIRGAFLQFDAWRLLMGSGLAVGIALVSVLRVPKRVGIYEHGMIIHSPLFFSRRAVLWRDVRNVRIEKLHSAWNGRVDVEIDLRDRTTIFLGPGVDDAEGIAHAASYQRGNTTPQVASPWG